MTKRLSRMALLTAIALIVHFIEAQLPPIVAIPGVKMGLSNVVTLVALLSIGWKDALCILLMRIVLSSLFAGAPMAMLYALAGGLLAFIAMFLLLKVLSARQIWAAGVVGAIAHNIGQMGVALLVTETPSILYYLPPLILAALATGFFTGLCAQYLNRYLARFFRQ